MVVFFAQFASLARRACDEALGAMTGKIKAETKVVKAILDALNGPFAQQCEAWRWQSGIVAVKRGWMHLAPKGTPDLGGYLRRYGAPMFVVETKASHSDACSCDGCSAQREWRDRFVAVGGLYVFARQPHEALEKLGLLGLISSSRLDLTDSNSTEKTKNQSGASVGLSRDQGLDAPTNQKVCRIS